MTLKEIESLHESGITCRIKHVGQGNWQVQVRANHASRPLVAVSTKLYPSSFSAAGSVKSANYVEKYNL